tara:strand:- start:28182 stop:29153 length:972 start_codon:yes stop_codon:yes gene_type:complete
MSLVNDVLRQIDEKSYSNDGIKAALPLSLQQNSSGWDKPRVVLLSLTALILVVYILQRLIIGYFNDERSQALDPSYAVDSTYNVIAKDEIFAINADVNSTKDSDDSQNIRQSQPKDATVFIAATPVAKAPVPASIPVPKLILTQDVKPQKIASQKKVASQEPIISKKARNHEAAQYQEALGQFIAGNIESSEHILKNLLNKSIEEPYLELQARIYIQRNEGNSFYQLVKKYPQNNSITWYKLIAPGLQLFSYYRLSNQYYDSLVKLEPNEIRWQLAIALNYSRLGDNEKSIAVYENLASSDQVSDRQKQWLLKKIKRLTLSKA